MQVAVELGPRQLAGVTLHLKILGCLLGDEQEVLIDGKGREMRRVQKASRRIDAAGVLTLLSTRT